MNSITCDSGIGLSGWQKRGPFVTLLLLSPVIGEVMSGATRLSYIFVLVPEIMVWGCGTLLIRELVRRWRGGWTSVLLLGFGLSIAEEFLIQQTSLAPLPWAAAAQTYGRVWGVNWPYFLFMLGYEAVWIVLVPTQITELLFPRRRDETWVGGRGLVIAGVVFLAGSFMAWFLWTQRARPLMFHVPPYRLPMAAIVGGALAIIGLVLAAYRWRHAWRKPEMLKATRPQNASPGVALDAAAVDRDRDPMAATAPHPWVVAATVLLLGLPWYSLMVLVFAPAPRLPLLIPLLAAVAWGTGALLLVKRWSLAAGWHDLHQWALGLGALLVCMLGGFLGAGSWPPMDTVAKAALNIIAIGCMAMLGWRIARRSAVQRR